MSLVKGNCESGSTTLEYAILMPVVFACVVVAIILFLTFYQKALIQNLADQAAQSLARQWGYKPLPVDELETGVYNQTTYENREVYWNIKFWNTSSKEKDVERYITQKLQGLGPLKEYKIEDPDSIDVNSLGFDPENPVAVNYKWGIPSTLIIDIRVAYRTPGSALLKLLGLGDCLIMHGRGMAQLYDTKDMINTTDYVIQLIRGTRTYNKFMEKIEPLKDNLQKFIGD